MRRRVACASAMETPYKTPDLPPLPKSCVGSAIPFSTGTLYGKEPIGECKVYICIFTCTSTRAIHSKIVTDLSTEPFYY